MSGCCGKTRYRWTRREQVSCFPLFLSVFARTGSRRKAEKLPHRGHRNFAGRGRIEVAKRGFL
ncbi:UNVERIFIED_ORG: hypothetical protein B5F06_03650 [Lacrimispora saccharolytica]|nr:hypothetical protein DW757_13715 [Clostridium sp. AM29-11AC]CBK77164.1 hypothetical protein CLS_15820 [[Clostridium] cf. saccharolyticum K10]